jgi:hypothetical protein
MPSSKTLTVIEAQLAAGVQAEKILQAAQDRCPICTGGEGPTLFHQREAQIVNELILWFRAGVEGNHLDPQIAVRYAAALSEVRALREELEHRVRKGRDAQKTLVTADTAATSEE